MWSLLWKSAKLVVLLLIFVLKYINANYTSVYTQSFYCYTVDISIYLVFWFLTVDMIPDAVVATGPGCMLYTRDLPFDNYLFVHVIIIC